MLKQQNDFEVFASRFWWEVVIPAWDYFCGLMAYAWTILMPYRGHFITTITLLVILWIAVRFVIYRKRLRQGKQDFCTLMKYYEPYVGEYQSHARDIHEYQYWVILIRQAKICFDGTRGSHGNAFDLATLHLSTGFWIEHFCCDYSDSIITGFGNVGNGTQGDPNVLYINAVDSVVMPASRLPGIILYLKRFEPDRVEVINNLQRLNKVRYVPRKARPKLGCFILKLIFATGVFIGGYCYIKAEKAGYIRIQKQSSGKREFFSPGTQEQGTVRVRPSW